jgi:FeS assembly SUF system protein
MRPETTSLDTSRLNPQAKNSVPGEPSAAEQIAPKTPPAEPLTFAEVDALKNDLVAALCTCFDPEIPVNIYELGLIYDILISPLGEVEVRMTLTSPACPVAGSLPGDVRRKLLTVPKVLSAKVEVVWEPPWDKERMSEAAKLQLGID